jgi:hypothetical protein
MKYPVSCIVRVCGLYNIQSCINLSTFRITLLSPSSGYGYPEDDRNVGNLYQTTRCHNPERILIRAPQIQRRLLASFRRKLRKTLSLSWCPSVRPYFRQPAAIFASCECIQQNSTCRNAGYPDRLDPTGKFVENSTKLICLEITGHRIKYNTELWLLERQSRSGRKV